MKKNLLLISSLLLACNFVFSQVILTYKTHGLVPGTSNPMKLIEYIEAGDGGQGVIWDFSMIKEKESFQGELTENNSICPAAAGATVVLKEFKNYFAFAADENKLEQYGYFGENSESYTRYDEPFIKMKYPFAYGNAYAGSFSGGMYNKDTKVSTISGNYEVSADGTGTLILPNGITYRNALRVKEVKRTNYGSSQFEEITYRWYLKNHRFPVLVFIKSGTVNASCVSFLSAYNPNITELKAISSDLEENNEFQIEIFPKPASDFVTTKINLLKDAKVVISLYDGNGKYLGHIANAFFPAGMQTFTISADEKSLKFGLYFLKINIDGNESVKNFLIE